MPMSTAEQLRAFTRALEIGGYERVAGNLWRYQDTVIRTAYVANEATIWHNDVLFYRGPAPMNLAVTRLKESV